MELTLEELEALQPGSYTLLDLRSEQETAYGTIPGSVPANAAALPEGLPAEPGRIVLFCLKRPNACATKASMPAASRAAILPGSCGRCSGRRQRSCAAAWKTVCASASA